MFGREFKNLLTIRNLKSSKLANSSIFGLEFAHRHNSLQDYRFGIVIFYYDLAQVYCLLPNPFLRLARCFETKKSS